MLNKIKVGTKLVGGFLIVALIALGVGLFAIDKMKSMQVADEELYEKGAAPMEQLIRVGVNFQKIRLAVLYMNNAKTHADILSYSQETEKLGKEVDGTLQAFGATLVTEEGKKTLATVQECLNKYLQILQKVKSILEDPSRASEISEVSVEMQELAKNLNEAIDTMTQQKVGVSKQLADANKQTASSVVTITLILLLIAVALAVFLGIWISRSITRPLGDVVLLANRVAEGDLSQKVSVSSEDEVGLLGKAINAMVDNLHQVVGGIKNNSQTVSSSAEELSAVSRQLLTSAEEMVNQSVVVAGTTEQMSTN
ncbi:MAG TPA: MCP four helix bundle domain-containing protein, partial [Fibrobacteraceae bacterium]|nr:MCP four helix bundle domain-containing protein [Fibrobacteraceae bacterium]